MFNRIKKVVCMAALGVGLIVVTILVIVITIIIIMIIFMRDSS